MSTSNLEVTIDLETLDVVGSKKRMPAILSIGATVFDPNVIASESDFVGDVEEFAEKVRIGKPFANYSMYYSPVSLAQSLRHGFTHSPDTLRWWEHQPFNQLEQSAAHTDKLVVTFADFLRWLKHVNPKKVWANAPSFDLSILRESFDHMGLTFDIEFRSERDVRTVYDMMEVPRLEMSSKFPKHNALCDAIWAAMMVQRCYAKRRYFHNLEIENAGLKERIAELTKQLANTESKYGASCES